MSGLRQIERSRLADRADALTRRTAATESAVTELEERADDADMRLEDLERQWAELWIAARTGRMSRDRRHELDRLAGRLLREQDSAQELEAVG